jgi:ribosomal protein S12 methylthiotransferase accessory factor YcaO
MELAQTELAYRLSAAKRDANGEAVLNVTDREHIRRFSEIETITTPVIKPLAPPQPSCNLRSHEKVGILAGIRQRLEAVGVEVYGVNLTRPALGIPVVRMFAPNLEMGLTSPPGPRLLATAERFGVDPTRPILL